MHMLFRTILHAWISRFGKQVGHYDVVSTKLRVLPTDLDILRHMNNGVYFSLFDIGRFDLIRRSGIWKIFMDHGWYPVVASETITFRKSLQLWQAFTVESRIIGFDDKAAYMQHRAVVNGEIYAEAFIKARFLKRTGGTVPVADLLDAVGQVPPALELPEWLVRWGDDVKLPSTRAEAPSTWE
ncbi:acyl-CoA thioesterase [Planctomonas sp. JC2975]|uniref:acyl-CoA thioesterase n=1 Tax=Planctomonas sp. JC2975 TaxID=2729626 RepID=UPI001472E957|nr:acyl-CoA thioesterase [Planctomonas sp. JC2975]NNC12728.1 acyl-CoA thioesterase [Planctomonas sp. JC2975]